MEPALNVGRASTDTPSVVVRVRQSPAKAIAGVRQAQEPGLTPAEAALVDARQDELMKIESVDGRPPEHQANLAGWRRIAIGLPLLAIIGLSVAMLQGVSVGAIALFMVASALVVFMGAWPVLVAGLLRGGEETVARKEAMIELKPPEVRSNTLSN